MSEIMSQDVLILEILKEGKIFMGPTEIGLKLGKSYNTASSYCNRPLKRLLAAGLIEKGGRKYRIKS